VRAALLDKVLSDLAFQGMAPWDLPRGVIHILRWRYPGTRPVSIGGMMTGRTKPLGRGHRRCANCTSAAR